MKLPNADHAVVEIEKLTDYCLSYDHPRGKHKARVFESTCGITANQADTLRLALLEAAKLGDATAGPSDKHGERFVIEWRVVGPVGLANITTIWIVRAGEDFPRFVSAYVR